MVLMPQAASPDEEALVQGAAMLGFRLLSRSIDQVPPPLPCRVAPLSVLVSCQAALSFATMERMTLSTVSVMFQLLLSSLC